MTHTFERIASSEVASGEDDAAHRCAARVQFIHVLRSRNLRNLLQRVMESKRLDVPENRGGTTTGRSEAALGLNPSVYLYAGRAFPTTEAQAACVVPGSSMASVDSSPQIAATPFDTGGLHLGRLQLDWQNHNDGSTDPREYLQKHSVSFPQFSGYFAGFLRRFFGEPENYWKAPINEIDGAKLHSTSDMRNWAFEIRCEDRVSVADAEWFFDDEMHREYTSLLAESGLDPLRAHYVPIATEVALTAENWSRMKTFAVSDS